MAGTGYERSNVTRSISIPVRISYGPTLQQFQIHSIYAFVRLARCCASFQREPANFMPFRCSSLRKFYFRPTEAWEEAKRSPNFTCAQGLLK